MRTDDLIALLSTNVEPVDRRHMARTIGVAVAVGALTSLGAMLFALGIRPDSSNGDTLIFLSFKLVFTLGVIGVASVCLIKLARPGGEFRVPLYLTALPFIGVMILATISLSSAPSSHWESMVERTG